MDKLAILATKKNFKCDKHYDKNMAKNMTNLNHYLYLHVCLSM